MAKLKSKYAKACDIPKSVKDAVWERDGHKSILSGKPSAMPNAHYIPRSHGGLGIEQNIVTLTAEEHRRFDSTVERAAIKEQIKAYLQSKYPGWDESKLVYHKYG